MGGGFEYFTLTGLNRLVDVVAKAVAEVVGEVPLSGSHYPCSAFPWPLCNRPFSEGITEDGLGAMLVAIRKKAGLEAPGSAALLVVPLPAAPAQPSFFVLSRIPFF